MIFKTVDQISDQEYLEVLDVYLATTSSQAEDIQYKYFDFYYENYDDFFLVALIDKKVAGYICGMPNTLKSNEIFELQLHLDFFREEIKNYPAHLHINIHPDFQGMGVGGKLFDEYLKLLRLNDVHGVHIITVNGEENNKFYNKMGFNFTVNKDYFGRDLLFMGKQL